MFTKKLPKKETPQRSLSSLIAEEVALLAEEAEAQKNNSTNTAPMPDNKRRWRLPKRGKKKPVDTITLVDGTTAARVCNAILANAIDQKASVITLKRSESGLEVTHESETAITGRMNFPSHLFQRIAARYLMMALTPRSTGGGPFFHQMVIVYDGKNYKVALSVTYEDELKVMTLRIKDA